MKNKRLVQSVLISAALHLAAAAVLFSKQLHFYPKFLAQIGKTPSLFLEQEEIALLKKNQALEDALGYFELASATPPSSGRSSVKLVKPDFEPSPVLPQIALSFPLEDQDVKVELKAPVLEREAVSLEVPRAFNLSLLEISKEIVPEECDISKYSPAIPSLPENAPKVPQGIDWIALEEMPLGAVHLPLPESSQTDNHKPSLKGPVLSKDSRELPAVGSPDFQIRPQVPASITHARQNLSLKDYGLPAVHLKEWNEFFDVDVKTFPHEEKGFLFSVSLIPKRDLSEYCLKQNYLFIIDRSNSIDKHRYQSFKRAALRAICALREGDYFNVLLLDAKLTMLSEKPLAFTKANQRIAEAFLEKQPHGYRGADIYASLAKITTFVGSAHEATTAILISDGDSSFKQSQQRKKINQWIEANQDRITLYTAAAGYGNNLSALKILGLASRGSLLYSDTHASFPRKLTRLVMDLRYPIAKEMTVSLVPSDASDKIEFLPPASRLPYLFSDHPFVLMGSCETLADFTLVLEGKNRDQDLVIKKAISLSKAKPASRLLMKQWMSEKTHDLLDQYLREGDITLLQQAEKELGYDSKNSRR